MQTNQDSIRRFKHYKINGKDYFEINSSALGIYQTCPRKFHYIFDYGFEHKVSSAAHYGTMIHQALESWYSIPTRERNSTQLLKAWDAIYNISDYIPSDDKRTKDTGNKVLAEYARQYQDDPWEIYVDKTGPYTERQFELIIHDGPFMQIKLFGTIDMLVKNKNNGEIAVMDHKTTSSIGKDFCNRWEVNHQLTGYILGAAQSMNLPWNIDKAIINGIQIAKTKQQVIRIQTMRDKDDFDDLKNVLMFACNQYITSKETGFFPMASGAVCSSFGGCQFLEVCSAKNKFRPTILKSLKDKPFTEIEE